MADKRLSPEEELEAFITHPLNLNKIKVNPEWMFILLKLRPVKRAHLFTNTQLPN